MASLDRLKRILHPWKVKQYEKRTEEKKELLELKIIAEIKKKYNVYKKR